jgi:short-subunit dehydrogenase
MNPDVRICNLSRSKPSWENTQHELSHIACDLSKSLQIAEAVPKILDWLASEGPKGRILLVNNSGFGFYGSFPEPSIDQQLEMIDVNVKAVVRLTGLLLPVLRERGGVIMTIASTAAFQPTPYLAAYGATKTFVLHWSLALNEELKGSGVNAIAVCPGPTSTQFFRRAGLKEGSVGDSLGQTSEQVALEALRAMAKGKALVVTGWKNKLLAFMSSKSPKVLGTRVSGAVLARYRLSAVKR